MGGFDRLFAPAEHADEWLTGLFEGAPLPLALLIAFLLGLRHASDPDHLVAVTSLVAMDQVDTRAAVRLGAWWGVGHATTVIVIGAPLIIFKSELPGWLESGAETAVGVVILLLAALVIRRQLFRAGGEPSAQATARTPARATAIGVLHGLAGTGAIVLLLIAALPTRMEALAALGVFAPMSVISMAACTGAFAWVLTRRRIEPLYRTVLLPALCAFGLVFGLWYSGLT